MKKLFYVMLIAFMVTAFTGCSKPSDGRKGTAPEFNEFFLTNYQAPSTTNFEDLPRLTTATTNTYYSVVVDFHDPDFDVKEVHVSVDNFQTEDILTISSQVYEYQVSWWDGISFTAAGTAYFKAYILDKAGNKSNILSKTITITASN